MQDPKVWGDMRQAPTFYCGNLDNEGHNPASIFASVCAWHRHLQGIVKEHILMDTVEEERSQSAQPPRIGFARI
jgi:hypothetical protein